MTTKIQSEINNPRLKQYFVSFNDTDFTANHSFVYEDGTIKTITEPRWEFEQRKARASLYPRIIKGDVWQGRDF